MCRCRLVAAVMCVCLLGWGGVRGQEQAGDEEKFQKIEAEVAKLRAEVESLRAENAALKEKLAAAGGPKSAEPPAPGPFELGAEARLGLYAYRAPLDWRMQGVKGNANGALYRSADNAAVILATVRRGAAVAPEIAPKYAQNVIAQLKNEFVKSKTEVLEPPAVQQDPRFFLKVRERVMAKDKPADQTHLYRMEGKDLIEVTVITTSEAPEQVEAARKLAEDVLLSFRPAK